MIELKGISISAGIIAPAMPAEAKSQPMQHSPVVVTTPKQIAALSDPSGWASVSALPSDVMLPLPLD